MTFGGHLEGLHINSVGMNGINVKTNDLIVKRRK